MKAISLRVSLGAVGVGVVVGWWRVVEGGGEESAGRAVDRLLRERETLGAQSTRGLTLGGEAALERAGGARVRGGSGARAHGEL
jgi:hypothetical protein